MPPSAGAAPELSIVVPAFDEQDNVSALVAEIEAVFGGVGLELELIVVDDGSGDETLSRLRALAATRSWMRVLALRRRLGISHAFALGFRAAQAPVVATLDADLQNDPRDLAAMWTQLQDRPSVALIQGDRTGQRRDSRSRRCAAWVGRLARGVILGDRVRDTGCSTRVLRKEMALRIPLQFEGMHRFIPAYVRLVGGEVLEVPVRHRPRHSGTSKVGIGLYARGVRGFFDCVAVRWMERRHRSAAADSPAATAVGSPAATAADSAAAAVRQPAEGAVQDPGRRRSRSRRRQSVARSVRE